MTPWLCWKRCTKILLPCHCAVAILPCQKKQMPLIQLGVWNDKGYQPKLGICLNVLDQKPTWFLGASPHLLRDLSFFHHFHGVFFSQFSISNHLIEASPQALQVCQGQRRPWEKLPANLVRKPSTVSTLETKNLYRVLWWIYLFVTQNSLGKKNKHLGIYYQMSMFHWLIWQTPNKRPNKTYCNTNFQSSKTNNSNKSSMYIVSNLSLRLSYFPLAILPHHLLGWGWPDSSCWKRLRKSSKATCSWQRYTPSHLRECLLPQKETHLTNPPFPGAMLVFVGRYPFQWRYTRMILDLIAEVLGNSTFSSAVSSISIYLKILLKRRKGMFFFSWYDSEKNTMELAWCYTGKP